MAKDANGNEIPETPPGAMPGTIGGWAKNVVLGGPPQAVAPMSDVPAIVAGAPGAYIGATVDAGKRDLGLAGPPAPTAGAEDPIFPGTAGDMRGNDDALEALRAEMLLHESVVGDNTKAPPKFYQDAGEDYSPVGGRRGKELLNRAYGDGPDDGPARLQGAVRESEVAQSQKNEAMAKFYDGEATRATQAAATRKMAMEQDTAEMQMRQERMEKATQFYTDDLANKGQFWSKPENIVAAISFSLMPIFSSDPSIGVKLVNQAIQQDMEHRRQSASMALGAMRSNLDGYHKIVGDRQAGEQLAEAEARRVAAMEVERISAKFESPISKAKAEAIIQDLRIKSAQGYMQAYNQAKVFQPAKVQDPGLFKGRTKGYEGAWTSLNVPDVAPLQSVGAAANGDVAGSPSLAGSGGPNGGYTQHVAPEVRGMLRGGVPASVAAKLALEGRVPGSANMFNMLSSYVNRAAAAHAKGITYGPAFTEAKQVVFEKAAAEIKEKIGDGDKGFAKTKATLHDLIASAEVVAASETAAGRDPDKFLGVMRNIVGESFSQKYEELVRAFSTKGGSPAEIREQARRGAVDAFRQKLMIQMSQSYNDISGGAITSTELPRLEAFMSKGSDFGFAYNWLKNRSLKVQGEEKQAVINLSPLAKILYMTRTGVGQRPQGLPVRGTAGPKKPAEGMGEFSGMMSGQRGGTYSSQKSGD